MNLQSLDAAASPELQVNENFETLDFASVYGKRQSTTSALTRGYYGGRWSGFSVAAGTLTLTDNSANYIVVQRSDGAISTSTANTNWNNTASYARVYKLTTASGVVTAEEDHRAGLYGVHGPAAPIDTDGTLSANSDAKVASQKATKTYIDGLLGLFNGMVYKGATDCSANPNYPAADAGDVYAVSVAGKIGGASGTVVEAGDLFLCKADSTASGNQATVGSYWDVIQVNIVGAVSGPASATDSHIASFDGTTGKLIKDSGLAAPSGAIVGTTDTQTLSNKRVTARVGSTTSSATPTINTDNVDIYKLTAQAADITSFTTNLSGTPNDGDVLVIQITGTAARAITWGSAFEASAVALPTTTVTTAMLTVGFLYNAVTSKWRCVASC